MSTSSRREHVSFDDSPAQLTAVASVLLGGLAVLVSGIVSALALLFGVLGWLLLLVGLFSQGSRSMVSLGAGGVFLCVVLAGVLGAPTELLIIGMLGTILAWDFGHHSIVIGRQLGAEAHTFRAQAVHAAVSGAVGVLTAGLSYVSYLFAAAGQPFPSLLFILVAILLFAWSIRT